VREREREREMGVGRRAFASSGVNFINILHTNFLYKLRIGSFFYLHVTREKLPKQRAYKKFVRKMLMKLTIGQ